MVEQIQKEARPSSTEVPFAKSALALFILCTCIEGIGGSDEFLPYNNWLESRKSKQEVTDLIEKHKDKDKLSFLKSIHREYKDKYGFRSTYKNFFHSILTKEWQDRLASCVTILVNKPPNFEPERKGEPLDNLAKYLEDFRNKFTHLLELRYQVPLEKELPEGWSELYPKANFFTYEEIRDDGSCETILTRDLINTLLQCISSLIPRARTDKS